MNESQGFAEAWALLLSRYERGQVPEVEELSRLVKLSIFENGEQSVYTACSIFSLASLYEEKGESYQAETLHKKALGIFEQVEGSEHQLPCMSHSRLGNLLLDQGRYNEAEFHFKRALSIQEKIFGAEHPDTATTLNHMGMLLRAQGQLSRAKVHSQRAMEIREQLLGLEHPDTAMSLNNLALIYLDLAQIDEAEKHLQRALKIFEKALRVDHADFGIILGNLATIYLNQGQYGMAENYLWRAQAITEKALGYAHPTVARGLNSLGSLYFRKEQYSKSEELNLKALDIRERSLAPEHPDISSSLNNLALIYHRQSKYDQALPLYLKALKINAHLLDVGHPEAATYLINVGHLCQELGRYTETEQYLKTGLHIIASWLRKEILLLPASQRLSLKDSKYSQNGLAFALAAIHPPSAYLALWARLNFHGLIQEIEKQQLRLNRLPGSHQELITRLRCLVGCLSSSNVSVRQRTELKAELDGLESKLNLLNPGLFTEPVEINAVAQALPVDALLIEIQRYYPLEGARSWGEPRYLGLVLNSAETVALVDIGPAHLLEALIVKAMDATAKGYADVAECWMELSNAFLPKLLRVLGKATRCFLSLDGQLHRVPFHALPMPGQPDNLFSDFIQISILSTGRDLIRNDLAATTNQGSVVVANPHFDLLLESTSNQADADSSFGRRSREQELFHRWEPLPSTEQEGRQVASLLNADLFTGEDATTKSIQLASQPLVLHIATHGFFLPDHELQEPRQQMASFEGGDLLANFRGEDPMLRSGLVLAGANHPGSDPEDDGYLTALEATHLALQGTELVTLSACDTGSGDICTGEGVFGLQRALIVAGARSTLLSLWKVPDDATCAFMVRYYSLLKEGEGRADALRQVQREFRQHANFVWQHPYYWAAWQLVGDSGPIEGL